MTYQEAMTNNKQKSAVEWYDNEIGKLFDQFTMGKIKIYEFQNQRFKLEKQAKEMAKEQIIKAAQDNFYVGQDLANGCCIEWNSAEDYYNETYGGGNK